MQKPFSILVLCTGNSARSILGEALFNLLGQGRVQAYSAGSHPSGRVNPFAIERLEQMGYPTNDLRSKSWDEFSRPDAVPMDFVITVCDNAAAEACPLWLGAPMQGHWGFPDPAAVEGTDEEKRAAFALAERQIRHRVEQFLRLPLETLDRASLQSHLRAIGEQPLLG